MLNYAACRGEAPAPGKNTRRGTTAQRETLPPCAGRSDAPRGTAKSAGAICASCPGCLGLRGDNGAHLAHICGSQQTNPRDGPVRRCERKGKGWAFVANTFFMEKKLVPEDLDFPADSKKTGKSLLRQDSVHFQLHHVYETTDAHGNIVYWAHEGSL